METLASASRHGPALPGFLNALAGPIDHYGIWAIALLLLLENIGVPVIPGEFAMIAGAIFAGTGRAGLNVVEVGVVSVAASIAGAEIGYLIGKFAGRELVLRYGRWVLIKPHHLDRAETIVSRYGGVVVIIARYIVGLREANGIIAGLTQMRWLTFAWFNVLGACAWVATWVSIGYVAGDAIGAIYRNVNRYALYVLLALAVLLAAFLIRRVVRGRRRQATSAEASETEQAPVTEEDSAAQETSAAQEAAAAQKDSVAKEDSRIGGDFVIRGFHEAREDSERDVHPEVEELFEPAEDHGTFESAEAHEVGDDSVTREPP